MLVGYRLAVWPSSGRFRVHRFGSGTMSEFAEWRDRIEAAHIPAPRTYQEAYKAFILRFAEIPATDKASGFHSGWMMACDALANRLVEWLDEPAGDDVSAFLGFVAELRKGDLL